MFVSGSYFYHCFNSVCVGGLSWLMFDRKACAEDETPVEGTVLELDTGTDESFAFEF